jgi:hypothetical protein
MNFPITTSSCTENHKETKVDQRLLFQLHLLPFRLRLISSLRNGAFGYSGPILNLLLSLICMGFQGESKRPGRISSDIWCVPCLVVKWTLNFHMLTFVLLSPSFSIACLDSPFLGRDSLPHRRWESVQRTIYYSSTLSYVKIPELESFRGYYVHVAMIFPNLLCFVLLFGIIWFPLGVNCCDMFKY